MNIQDSDDNNPDQGGEEELYDEFGNYIGPDLDSSDEDDSDNEDEDEEDEGNVDNDDDDDQSMESGGPDSNPNNMIIEHDPTVPATAPSQNQIVLHEDKVHYPSASTIYGPNVTTAVIDEDAMDIETPIMPPSEPSMTTTTGVGGGDYESDDKFIVKDKYLVNLLDGNSSSSRNRGIVICGKLQSGKSSFVDLLRSHTLIPNEGNDNFATNKTSEEQKQKYTHRLKTEQKHNMTLSSTPLTLPLSNSNGQTYAFTMVDTPGHVQFHDEAIASLKLMDGCAILIDIVEGMTYMDEITLSSCISAGVPIIIVLHKIDKLILDLKLPLNDAYMKIKNILDGINVFVRTKSNGRYPMISPLNGNVLFGSSLHGYIFSLESMADLYMDHTMDDDDSDSDDDDDDSSQEDEENSKYNKTLQAKKQIQSAMFGTSVFGKQRLSKTDLQKRLWGNTYYNSETKKFTKKPTSGSATGDKRTFCTFILEPLYKLYTTCLSENEKNLNKALRSLGIHLSKDQLRSDVHVLLNIVMRKFFGDCRSFVDMVVKNVPTPLAASFGKVSRCYTGPTNTGIASSMIKCDPNGKLMIHVTKLYANGISSTTTSSGTAPPAGQTFSAFGRIYSGSIKQGDKVKVLGEAYSPEDDEDASYAVVKSVSISRGRYKTEVNVATAGNWVLIDGVDASIAKTATITSTGGNDDDDEDEVRIFAPLKFPQVGGESVMKLSVEPLNPAELPKMVEGLRRISKAYPMALTRVEESGEHVIFGTGELYLDCIMHDLRHVYSNIEVKVADPVVGFRETVVDTSSLKCFAETANKRNKLTMIAEPLDEGLAEQLEAGKVKINEWDNKKVGRYFQSKYDWDLLSARSVWAFGDSPTHGPNILMDDTLPSEVDKTLLSSCKPGMIQGFQWATREGPLCEEPVRSTKLKILDTVLADKPIHRGAGQIIPTARKVVHSSLLTAQPKLLEPVYRMEIQCNGDIVDGINPLISKRRGHVVQDKPIPGSPFYMLKAFMPVMDSFGFETDLRVMTQGQAMVQSVFDHWAVVPGDPLDKNIILHPLEPSPQQHLARDFLVKTRRRKGLSEDVSMVKFFDEDMREQL
mmetsp:Transcript_18913/g.28330  ORF Transcript_18913/g.28330 Transcript_18913/m.28330 type:complete len:1088 (+) Transcript_18913:192-3455(+)